MRLPPVRGELTPYSAHGTRVGAVPAGTEGGRYEGVACNNGGYRAGKEETRHEQR